MKFIADFHIHLHCSVATSQTVNPQYLEYWARIKGIIYTKVFGGKNNYYETKEV